MGLKANPAKLRTDNHYVPDSYLRRWADDFGQIQAYRVLVRHPNVRLWKALSPKSVAYQRHLYTRVVAGRETDDIECWFDEEFEAPAAEVIRKVLRDGKLTSDDWQTLIRFLAAQDVRTPARLVERLTHWHETLPDLIQDTLTKSVEKLEQAHRLGVSLPKRELPHSEFFPARVTTELRQGESTGLLQLHTTVGRGLWLFSIKHLLTYTVEALLKHRWTILRSPPGLEWLTSDNPVVRLNYHNPRQYDFGGGWGSEGTEIFLPLSPKHLMYTRIGTRPPPKGSVVTTELALALQRFTVEHAYRYVFAKRIDPDVACWRPRIVDADAVVAEAEQWKQWHAEQSAAERECYNK